jgi:hypothetical protein
LRNKIGLIACCKRKATHRAPASQLYTSFTFRERVKYVNKTCRAWFIMSSVYGIISPDTVIEPYDYALDHKRKREQLVAQIRFQGFFLKYKPAEVEIHAGQSYWWHLEPWLLARGIDVSIPTRGLTIIETYNWLWRRNK